MIAGFPCYCVYYPHLTCTTSFPTPVFTIFTSPVLLPSPVPVFTIFISLVIFISSECPNSGPCVSRPRGHLPVQMVLPQVQAHRSSHSPSGSIVATSGPAGALSPPAHSKPVRQLSGLAYGVDGQFFPISHHPHHQYRSIHSSLLDLKVTPSPDIESFEPSSSGGGVHGINSFSPSTERHAYHSRNQVETGLALGGGEGPGPAIYTSTTDPPVVAAERSEASPPGTGLAQLTTNHERVRPAVVPAKVSASPSVQRYHSVPTDPAGHEGFGNASSGRMSGASINDTNPDTARNPHTAAGNGQSSGSDISDGIVGVTNPYHVATSSALSDADLDQEFQQHLLEFKALEKLAERKAREQMHVAIMRKRKAEMLRVMEIKKARREMMLKGKKLGMGTEHQAGPIDNRGAGMGESTPSTSSISRQRQVASVLHARHAMGLVPPGATPLRPQVGKYDDYSMRHFFPNHMSGKGSLARGRSHAASTARLPGGLLPPSTLWMRPNLMTGGRRSGNVVSVSAAASPGRRSTASGSEDVSPLNLSSEGPKSLQASPVSGETLQRPVGGDTSRSPCRTPTHPRPNVSVSTAATSTVTTTTTSSSVASVASSGSISSSFTVSRSEASEGIQSTVVPSVALSTSSVISSSKNTTTDVSFTSLSGQTASVRVSSNPVQSSANVRSESPSAMTVTGSLVTSQTLSESISVSGALASSSSVSTVSTTQSISCVLAVAETSGSIKSSQPVTDLSAKKLKEEILESSSAFQENNSGEAISFKSANSSSQDELELGNCTEIKMEIVEEDDVEVSLSSLTDLNSATAMEVDKPNQLEEQDNSFEISAEKQSDGTSLDKVDEESPPEDRQQKTDWEDESQVKEDKDGDGSTVGVRLREMKVEKVKDAIETACSESGIPVSVEEDQRQEFAAMMDSDYQVNDDIESLNVVTRDFTETGLDKMSHGSDLSSKPIPRDSSFTPGAPAEQADSMAVCPDKSVATSDKDTDTMSMVSSKPVPNLKTESRLEEGDASSHPGSDDPERPSESPATPAAAHQAPKETAPMDLEPDFPVELPAAPHQVTGAFHRRDIAVLKPPFAITADKGYTSALDGAAGSSPLPAHNQKPFQAAGNLIVLGKASAVALTSTTTDSETPSLHGRPVSNSAIVPSPSFTSSSPLTSLPTLASSSTGPSSRAHAVNKSTESAKEREQKVRAANARRLSIETSVSGHKVQTSSGNDRGMDMRYRPADQLKSSVQHMYSEMSSPTSYTNFTPPGEPVCLTKGHSPFQPPQHVQLTASTSQAQHQASRSDGNSSLGIGSEPYSSSLDESKGGVGSKRSAFKALARKQQVRENSVLDLSVDTASSPHLKGVYQPEHPHPSAHQLHRSAVPVSSQDSMATDNFYLQGRKSDPSVHTTAQYSPGQPSLSEQSPASGMIPPSSSSSSAGHSSEVPSSLAPAAQLSSVSMSSSSKRLSGSLDKDRARPGGFLTMRHRILARDASLRTSGGMHLFTTDTDNTLAGQIAGISQFKDHVRPSISSVAQHRLRYQKPEGPSPVASQLTAPPLAPVATLTDTPPSSGLAGHNSGGYDGTSAGLDSRSSGAHYKVTPPRPGPHISGDMMYSGLERGSLDAPNHPQMYPALAPLSETMPEKHPSYSHHSLDGKTARLGPSSMNAHPDVSYQRQTEILLKQKHDPQLHQMAPVSGPGYPPHPGMGVMPVNYMAGSKQRISPGSQLPISGPGGPDMAGQQMGSAGAAPPRPSGYRSQHHDTYSMPRSQVQHPPHPHPHPHPHQHQSQQQQHEKLRRQHSDHQPPPQQQQQQPHFASGDGTLLRSGGHSQMPEGALMSGPPMQVSLFT